MSFYAKGHPTVGQAKLAMRAFRVCRLRGAQSIRPDGISGCAKLRQPRLGAPLAECLQWIKIGSASVNQERLLSGGKRTFRYRMFANPIGGLVRANVTAGL